MFVDMETERGNAGPESEVGVVWTGIETPEEERNRTRMVWKQVGSYIGLALSVHAQYEL